MAGLAHPVLTVCRVAVPASHTTVAVKVIVHLE
jgi:hypothetical protein